jgi:hypothetical protein
MKHGSLTKLTAVGSVLMMLMSKGTGAAEVRHCSLEVGFSSDGAAGAVPTFMILSKSEAAGTVSLCVLNEQRPGFQRLMPGAGPVFCFGAFNATQAHLQSIPSTQTICSCHKHYAASSPQ